MCLGFDIKACREFSSAVRRTCSYYLFIVSIVPTELFASLPMQL